MRFYVIYRYFTIIKFSYLIGINIIAIKICWKSRVIFTAKIITFNGMIKKHRLSIDIPVVRSTFI